MNTTVDEVAGNRVKFVQALATLPEDKVRLVGEMVFEGRYCALGLAGRTIGLTDDRLEEGDNQLFTIIRESLDMTEALQDHLVRMNDRAEEDEGPETSWKTMAKFLGRVWGLKDAN